MPAPNFLGIGAQKAGTSWLFHNIFQHPDVRSGNRKELHYYDDPERYAQGREWYESQFTRNPSGSIVGECTPAYLWTVGELPPGATEVQTFDIAERVAADYGPDEGHDLRLIVCLRDPVDRAVSSFFHSMKHRRYPGASSPIEAARTWPGIIEKSRYATQIDAWLDHFPRQAFLFLVYETDIKPDDNKAITFRRALNHIGADSSYCTNDLYDLRNVRLSHFDLRLANAGPVASRVMRRLPRIARDHPLWNIPITDTELSYLASEFAIDVAYCENLLGRKLPWRRH